MRRIITSGLILKGLLFLLFFFQDVTISTSGNYPIQKRLRSDNVIPVALNLDNSLSDLDEFEFLDARINFLLNRYDMKGASVAVAKDGKLVYAKGIGYADLENGETVEPYHKFRIASISKLITAVAIMKMWEMNLLDLDGPVFGPQGILNDSIYLDYRDRRVEDITVRQLLNHSAGWSRRFGDHMFMPHIVSRELDISLPVDASDIIRFALGKRLHFRPGSGSSYSNLGYSILGEVIAKVSGMTYEDYVIENLLKPLGIQGMRIGGNLEGDRYDDEVRYYEQYNAIKVNAYYDLEKMVPMSYGGNDINVLGAAGGWIASPAELLRFVTALDGQHGEPGILSPKSLEIMSDRRLSGGQTIGWTLVDRQGNWWRTGTFAGTSALLMRRPDGISYSVIFNSSTYRGTTLASEILREVHTALNRVQNWPEHDLFYNTDLPFSPIPELADIGR